MLSIGCSDYSQLQLRLKRSIKPICTSPWTKHNLQFNIKTLKFSWTLGFPLGKMKPGAVEGWEPPVKPATSSICEIIYRTWNYGTIPYVVDVAGCLTHSLYITSRLLEWAAVLQVFKWQIWQSIDLSIISAVVNSE